MSAVSLTEELVSFDTVSSVSNGALCERLRELLEPAGAEVRLMRKPGDDSQMNLLARFGPGGRGGLVLAGHTDTVPWESSMRATTAPERDGRRLYGRGTCDMKGAIAAMVLAARAVDSRSLKLPLWLAFTFQEEIGCHGAKLLERTQPIPADHCIIGEPTGLRPVTIHKGYVTGRFLLEGTPCHSSDPEQGASALHAAARAVDAALALAPAWKELGQEASGLTPPWTTLNIGLMSGGSARNVVPEHASFTVEVRPLPGVDPEALLAELQAVVSEAVRGVPGVSWSFEGHDMDPPFSTSSEARVVKWLQERTGRAPGTVPFYTEGPMFNRMGAETSICGPGEIAQAHRVDEWVEMDALEEAVQVYRAAVEEFCT